jgi:4-oxalocrotonate tautomerase
MPLIQVKVYEQRLNDETTRALIAKLTDAFIEAVDDESVRDYTEVIVEGVARERWGVGGRTY